MVISIGPAAGVGVAAGIGMSPGIRMATGAEGIMPGTARKLMFTASITVDCER